MLIFSLFSMTRILHFNKKHSFYGLILFLIGFILNEGTLFSAGLLEWMAISSSSLQNNLLVIASFILLCSTIVISFSIRHPEKISLITENETKVSQ